MAKVQLIRPPMDEWYTISQLEENISYPVGLCLLAKAVREKLSGFEVEVIDGYNKPIEQTLKQVGTADFVGVTCVYSNYSNALMILENAKRKGARTAIGGANVTHLGKRILANRPFVDYAVVNDGEEALPEIILGTAGKDTPNLVYRDKSRVLESEIRRNAPLTTLFDLEDIVDRSSWTPQSIPISSIRGCIKAERDERCDFCSMKHKLAVMDPKLIWEQIGLLHKKYGFDYFWETGDSVFKGFLQKLLTERPAELSEVRLKFYICPEEVDAETAQILRRLNTQEVMMGIETPNDEILRRIGKKSTLADITRAVELLAQERIKLHIASMYGLTGETPESAERTYQFTKELISNFPITKIATSHAIPFPGTEMFRRLSENPEIAAEYPGNLNRDDKFDYNCLTRLYTKHFTSVDFDSMKKLVQETRALMIGKGYATSFDINP